MDREPERCRGAFTLELTAILDIRTLGFGTGGGLALDPSCVCPELLP